MTVWVVVLGLLCASASAAQDLPPDILADQYLLEATEAMEQGELQKAERAFKKIEALESEPPPTFAYFYGKLLAEHGVGPEVWRKGQALLKQFVISVGRESEYYTPTLKLLSMVEAKLEAARRAQADDAAYAAAAAQDTPEGYAEYLQRYPAGRHVVAAQAAQQRLRAEAARQRIFVQVNAQMVRIEGGTFTMGCQGGFFSECDADEKPAHQVAVRSFELSKYEVTQEVWVTVMEENPSEFQSCPHCPVENVSWEDAQAFLQKLNTGGGRYRLPSEAEWEYAARGGSHGRGYEYAGSDTLDAVGWYEENSGEKTHPVGQKQANEVGLYDLSGNVYEWVQDCWNENYRGAPSDGRAWERGDCSRRVLRGGSWHSIPRSLRSAFRNWNTADSRSNYSGFRVARSVD
ncbi:MAG: formylglycine-generating enzyme family protein [Desulfurellaceae bacterium]|nr:formylglycine-generating enzyme family protein [Desulfurellaceae bacterium]